MLCQCEFYCLFVITIGFAVSDFNRFGRIARTVLFTVSRAPFCDQIASPILYCYADKNKTNKKTDDEGEEETRTQLETDLDLTILLHDDTFVLCILPILCHERKRKPH